MYNKNFFDNCEKVILLRGSKKPEFGIKKNNFKNMTIQNILDQGHNVGIKSKKNNLTIIDLDTYKEGFKFDFDIDELCKTTYAQKSATGGIHLFYEYEDEIKQTQNPKINIDTRNDDTGYIVFSGSTFEGGKYEGLNELIPCKMPQEVKDFLLNNGFSKNKSCHKNIKENLKNYDKNILSNKNLFIPKSHLKQILDDKPLSFFNDVEFWKFTTVMKYLDAYDLWDAFNKKRDRYDFNKNNEIWNSVNPNKCNINLLVDLFNNKNIQGYYNLKHLPEFSLESEKINKNKLGYDFIQPNLNYIIKSDTGTGKTTSVKYFLHKTKDKFISIVSRKSLCQEQNANFNTDNFLECDSYEDIKLFKNNDNLIIQLDSILRVHNKIDLSQYIIILDEFESIIDYLFTSSTLKNIRVLIFQRFIEILKQCKNYICIDADITDKSIEFIKTFINREYKLIENEYKHNKGVKAYEIQTEELFIEKLKQEKKFLCCCDSASQAEFIAKKLNDESIILITSKRDEYIDFDKNDKIIYSPKVIYGIDSSMKRPVYAFYKEHTINPKSMVQQVSRCRNINFLYYHFVKKEYKHNPITYNEVLEINKKIVDCVIVNENNLIETNFKMIDSQLERDYIKLFSKFEYENICYDTNKFCHFLKLIEERGFILETYRMMKEKKKHDNNKIKDPDDNVDEYVKEFFSNDKNKKILDIIDLDLDRDIDIIRDNMKIISRYNFVQEYYNIKYFFYDNLNDSQLLQRLNNQNEFILGKISNNLQKLRLLIKFKELTGCKDTKNIESTILLNEEQINKFKDEYKYIFNKKYYDEKFDFSTLYNQDKILNKLYKLIFTSDITKSKMIRLGNERRYMYSVSDYPYNNFKELYDFRIQKNNFRNVLNDIKRNKKLKTKTKLTKEEIENKKKKHLKKIKEIENEKLKEEEKKELQISKEYKKKKILEEIEEHKNEIKILKFRANNTNINDGWIMDFETKIKELNKKLNDYNLS